VAALTGGAGGVRTIDTRSALPQGQGHRWPTPDEDAPRCSTRAARAEVRAAGDGAAATS
jgi:hypothetical protein